MCGRRWRSAVKDAKTLPGADCGTDHELLTAKIRIKLKKKKPIKQPTRYNLQNIPSIFKKEVESGIKSIDLDNRMPDELWEEIKNTISERAEKYISKPGKNIKSKWISDEAIKIAQDRRLAKNKKDLIKVRKLTTEFQRQVRKDKENYLNCECQELEENNKKGKTRDLFKKIREITGKFISKLGGLKNKKGKNLTEDSEIKQRWREYTEDLYKRDDSSTEIFEEKDFECEPTVTESEVRWAISELSNQKSPGVDGIPIELFKVVEEETVRALTTLLRQIWDKISWPKEWKQSIYVPIPKKGDPRICSNNRTIALIPHASKILLKILQRRIEPFVEMEMPDVQAGFRRGRGTRD